MATSTAPKTEPQHPPLARDAQGNLLEIPDGTAAWRICRQTTGRPKEIVGPDKRMLRFPLDTTAEALVDLCGADVYRVYALDDVGAVLDYIVTADVTRDTRQPRNAAQTEAPLLVPVHATTAAPGSDLRFALEAMAQMMRVNGEAMRAIAESQADWVKSVASARGFFRNAPPPYVPPPTPEDDADEYEDEPPPRKTIYDVIVPIAECLAPSVKPIVSALTSGAGDAPRSSDATDAGDSGDIDAELAARPNWEARDLWNLNYAAAKAKAKKAARQASPKPRASLQARVMSDPKLIAHFMAIKALLQPDEAMKLLALGERMSEREQESLLAEVSARSAEDAALLLRALLVELDDANPTTTDSAT